MHASPSHSGAGLVASSSPYLSLLGRRNGEVLLWDSRSKHAEPVFSLATSVSTLAQLPRSGLFVAADAGTGLSLRDPRAWGKPVVGSEERGQREGGNLHFRGYSNYHARLGAAVDKERDLIAACCTDGVVRIWSASLSSSAATAGNGGLVAFFVPALVPSAVAADGGEAAAAAAAADAVSNSSSSARPFYVAFTPAGDGILCGAGEGEGEGEGAGEGAGSGDAEHAKDDNARSDAITPPHRWAGGAVVATCGSFLAAAPLPLWLAR
jgi:hypothetical protein